MLEIKPRPACRACAQPAGHDPTTVASAPHVGDMAQGPLLSFPQPQHRTPEEVPVKGYISHAPGKGRNGGEIEKAAGATRSPQERLWLSVHRLGLDTAGETCGNAEKLAEFICARE